MKFIDIASRLYDWLKTNNVPTENCTFIMKVGDIDAAIAMDMSLQGEFGALQYYCTGHPMDVSKGFDLAGLRFRIDSPIHPHLNSSWVKNLPPHPSGAGI